MCRVLKDTSGGNCSCFPNSNPLSTAAITSSVRVKCSQSYSKILKNTDSCFNSWLYLEHVTAVYTSTGNILSKRFEYRTTLNLWPTNPKKKSRNLGPRLMVAALHFVVQFFSVLMVATYVQVSQANVQDCGHQHGQHYCHGYSQYPE